MSTLGIISDTHWSSMTQAITAAGELTDGVFTDVDAIIHAGDMLHPEIDMAFAPYDFYPVRGNMDSECFHIPVKRILTFAGINIGVIHGWGYGTEIEARASGEFNLQELNVLIYGHSHYPACHVQNGVLFFNPGSATECRRAPYHSVGLIRIDSAGTVNDAGNDEGGTRTTRKAMASARYKTGRVEEREILFCGEQQVTAEIINIDAVPEIV